ncbi:unnamed protein product [Gordionus sp. m RMFG-2023]
MVRPRLTQVTLGGIRPPLDPANLPPGQPLNLDGTNLILTPDNSMDTVPVDPSTRAIIMAMNAISDRMAALSTQVNEDRQRQRTPSPRHMSTPRERGPGVLGTQTSEALLPLATPSAPPIAHPVPLEPPATSAEAYDRLMKVWAGLQQDLLEPRCKANDRDRHEIKHIAEVLDILSPDSDIRMLKIQAKRIRVLALAIHWNWKTARNNDASYQEKFLCGENITVYHDPVPFRDRGRAGPSTSTYIYIYI